MGRTLGGPLFILGLALYIGGTFFIGFVFFLLVLFEKFPQDLDIGVTWILTTFAWWGIAVLLRIIGSVFLRNEKRIL